MSVSGKVIADLVLKKELPEKPTVVELGNQTYSVDSNVIKQIVRDFENSDLKGSVDLEKLKELEGVKPASTPHESGVPHVSEFFKALGFENYSAIDVNSNHKSLIMDLNENIGQEYDFKKQFDLVTNMGVSEHIFNQGTFLKNAHYLTKKGGIMLHILPFNNYINHGFYNFQPRIFYDLALANNYEILGSYMAEREGLLIDLLIPDENNTFFYQHLSSITKNNAGNSFIVSVLRKNEDNEFTVPVQGKYHKDLEGDAVDTYRGQKLYQIETPTKGLFVPPKTGKFEKIPQKIKRTVKKNILEGLRKTSGFILKHF